MVLSGEMIAHHEVNNVYHKNTLTVQVDPVTANNAGGLGNQKHAIGIQKIGVAGGNKAFFKTGETTPILLYNKRDLTADKLVYGTGVDQVFYRLKTHDDRQVGSRKHKRQMTGDTIIVSSFSGIEVAIVGVDEDGLDGAGWGSTYTLTKPSGPTAGRLGTPVVIEQSLSATGKPYVGPEQARRRTLGYV